MLVPEEFLKNKIRVGWDRHVNFDLYLKWYNENSEEIIKEWLKTNDLGPEVLLQPKHQSYISNILLNRFKALL